MVVKPNVDKLKQNILIPPLNKWEQEKRDTAQRLTISFFRNVLGLQKTFPPVKRRSIENFSLLKGISAAGAS